MTVTNPVEVEVEVAEVTGGATVTVGAAGELVVVGAGAGAVAEPIGPCPGMPTRPISPPFAPDQTAGPGAL